MTPISVLLEIAFYYIHFYLKSMRSNDKSLNLLIFLFIGETRKHFRNLKKRYSKKKQAFKLVTRLSDGGRKANIAEAGLKNYDFLSWLSPYLGLRETRK